MPHSRKEILERIAAKELQTKAYSRSQTAKEKMANDNPNEFSAKIFDACFYANNMEVAMLHNAIWQFGQKRGEPLETIQKNIENFYMLCRTIHATTFTNGVPNDVDTKAEFVNEMNNQLFSTKKPTHGFLELDSISFQLENEGNFEPAY